MVLSWLSACAVVQQAGNERGESIIVSQMHHVFVMHLTNSFEHEGINDWWDSRCVTSLWRFCLYCISHTAAPVTHDQSVRSRKQHTQEELCVERWEAKQHSSIKVTPCGGESIQGSKRSKKYVILVLFPQRKHTHTHSLVTTRLLFSANPTQNWTLHSLVKHSKVLGCVNVDNN